MKTPKVSSSLPKVAAPKGAKTASQRMVKKVEKKQMESFKAGTKGKIGGY